MKRALLRRYALPIKTIFALLTVMMIPEIRTLIISSKQAMILSDKKKSFSLPLCPFSLSLLYFGQHSLYNHHCHTTGKKDIPYQIDFSSSLSTTKRCVSVIVIPFFACFNFVLFRLKPRYFYTVQ